MHDPDMVHRDVKPSNVMLRLDGVTLIDFGVARAADQSQPTRTGVVVGTPAYMSPEQASGARRLTGAVDVLALGSVVAYAGCGRPPFGDESGHAVLCRIVHEQPGLDEPRALDVELAEVVASCLDKVPENRPTAPEPAELAADRAPATEPLWPTAIFDLLRPRGEFAAQVPEMPEMPEASEAAEPAPVPAKTAPGPAASAPEPEVVVGGGDTGRPERRRRTNLLLAALPVVGVVGAATLAVQPVPYMTGPHHDGAAAGTPGPSLSVSSAGPTPGSSGTAKPTGKASPSPSGSKKHDGLRRRLPRPVLRRQRLHPDPSAGHRRAELGQNLSPRKREFWSGGQ
ncbi:hypothetical protein ACE1SV_71270 [Streptomyces sp. E-15]